MTLRNGSQRGIGLTLVPSKAQSGTRTINMPAGGKAAELVSNNICKDQASRKA